MTTRYFLQIFCIVFVTKICFTISYTIEPGPKVVATKGAVWPKPKQQESFANFYVVVPQDFEFKVSYKIEMRIQVKKCQLIYVGMY